MAGEWRKWENEIFGKKEPGLIRHFGCSTHGSPEQLQRLVAEYDWDFVQIQLNYLDWESLKAKRLYEILPHRGSPGGMSIFFIPSFFLQQQKGTHNGAWK